MFEAPCCGGEHLVFKGTESCCTHMQDDEGLRIQIEEMGLKATLSRRSVIASPLVRS